MIIESAEEQDIGRIKEIYRSAFPENEHELVATLACKLLVEETEPEILSLIAKTNDTIMGHVAFSPVRIENNQNCKAYILAPLAVDSGYQKQIIGSTLIKQGLEILTDDGIHLVFVYGDPEFYSFRMILKAGYPLDREKLIKKLANAPEYKYIKMDGVSKEDALDEYQYGD